MKKSTFWKLMLILLPIAAVGLATTENSVVVFDTQANVTTYHSYFELVEASPLQMAAPLAAVLSLLSGVFAAVYLGAKKAFCLKAITWTAFAASIFAVLPVMIQGDVKVVPNVLLPILMLVEAYLAYTMQKKPMTEERTAPRLGDR